MKLASCKNLEPDRDRAAISSSPVVILIALFLSIPLVFVLAPRIVPTPPSNALSTISDRDNAEDLALFRRATLASYEPSVAGVRPRRSSARPKIAFLFLTNSDLSFAPLWERFFDGHQSLFNIYVHADPKSRLAVDPTPSFRGRFIAAKSTQRASPTLIAATRRLLAAALIDDPSNAFFAVLSQYCIPLHSFRYTYNAIFTNSVVRTSFFGQKRHRSFIEILDNEPGLWDRYVARGEDVMLPEVQFDRFRVGSQFFVLARRHAVMVVRDIKLWKKFKLPCLKTSEHTCYPEEHYFPTLMEMKDPQGSTRYTLTRVNWTDSSDGHPHTYYPSEISEDLIAELRSSNSTFSYLFARKFSPDCLQPLLELADSVIFRD